MDEFNTIFICINIEVEDTKVQQNRVNDKKFP